MAATSPSQPQGAAASLLNGLSVLEAFTSARPVLGVTEISERVGLHKSTVSRMLQGLAEAGYVQRDDSSGRYRLGLGLLGLAGPLLADLDVRRAALPHLEVLTEATGETSAISVWNGFEAVVIEQVNSPHQVKHSANIGTRYRKWASSSVRLFLADMEPERARQLIDSGGILLNDADRAAEGFDDIDGHLAQIREHKVAVNDGWTTYDEYGVSTGITDYRGNLACCLTISAPRSRVHHLNTAAQLEEALRSSAAAISARLGSQ